MNFLAAAYEVLKAAKEPLSAEEITQRARSDGLLRTSGRTPENTMRARLASDILGKGEASIFARSDPGRFMLREWGLVEYVAPRHKSSLLDEEVVVFPTDVLPNFVPTTGLWTEPIDGRGLVRQTFPMIRREAETRYDVIQLVSVFIVRWQSHLLTFKRTKRLPESRLHDVYSVHFGGHLNPEDIPTLFDIFAPHDGLPFLRRELHEELRLDFHSIDRFSYVGLLYDDSRKVSSQHLGIVYDVELAARDFEIGERGFLIDAKFESLPEIERRLPEFENWSELLVHHQLETQRSGVVRDS